MSEREARVTALINYLTRALVLFVLFTFSYFLATPLFFSAVPVSWLANYTDITPTVARVGEPLVFASTRFHNLSGLSITSTHTLYCAPLGTTRFRRVGSYTADSVTIRARHAPVVREWVFWLDGLPYIPSLQQTCQLESLIVVSIGRVERAKLYRWPPFDIQPKMGSP